MTSQGKGYNFITGYQRSLNNLQKCDLMVLMIYYLNEEKRKRTYSKG